MGLFSKKPIDTEAQARFEAAENILGKEVMEKVSGFTGTVTCYIRCLFGCIQCCVIPKIGADGKASVGEWYDIGRLEITGKGITEEEVTEPIQKKGGISNLPQKN